MEIKSISGVTCIVKDLAQTSAFYDALGFRLGKQDDSHLTCYVNWFWVDFIAADQASADAHRQEAQVANRGAGQYLHMKVEDVDAFYKDVCAKDMTPDGEPEGKRTTGRSFVLRDPDGYKLVFFEKK
jgi:catechol 2,3-dioxygenase-like lactoylglutathione lyase family enzyme